MVLISIWKIIPLFSFRTNYICLRGCTISDRYDIERLFLGIFNNLATIKIINT